MRSDLKHPRDVSIPSDLAEARRLQGEIEEALGICRFGEREVFGIKLALEEALVNAIKHGNKLDPTKKVHVQYSVSPDRFDIRIADEGAGFNPCDIPDPTRRRIWSDPAAGVAIDAALHDPCRVFVLRPVGDDVQRA